MSAPANPLCWEAAHDVKRAAALKEIDTSLCFECQQNDGRALRRLDANNTDLLICKKCATPCHRCDELLYEGLYWARRCEFTNDTSIYDNAECPEESLCRLHWDRTAPDVDDSDYYLESEDSRIGLSDDNESESTDDDTDCSSSDYDSRRVASSIRTAAGRLRFKWNGRFRRGYGATCRELEFEPWEWLTKSEREFNELHAQQYAHLKVQPLKFKANPSLLHAHERPTSLPSPKRVAK